MKGAGRLPIDLNSADRRELTQLPRIGADKARRIVRYRALRKGFRDWADFAATPGITEADVEAIRSRARIVSREIDWPRGDHRRTGRNPTGLAASTSAFRRRTRGRGGDGPGGAGLKQRPP